MTADDTVGWLAAESAASQLRVADAVLADSTDWAFRGGAIRHRSDRFFSVVGIRGPLGDQPLIEQREVGTLGFLVTRGASPRVLAHAKVEPGNVGGAQLAPTVQATASNADRVHGGSSPPFARLFASDAVRLRSRVLASEQGTRFLDKLNANVVAEALREVEHGPAHRWLPVDELLELTTHDDLVNTDARSVLVGADWPALLGRQPFGRRADHWGRRWAASWRAGGDVDEVRQVVRRHRLTTARVHIVPLDELEGWVLDDHGVAPVGGAPFRVRQITVACRGREVERWDQPIIDSVGDGLVELWVDDRGPHPLLGLRPTAEPGLRHGVELTATLVRAPGDDRDVIEPTQGEVIAEVRQSDEGGRFLLDRSLFRLVRLEGPTDDDAAIVWLSLGQVGALLAEGIWLTNEARSALGLLLRWL